MTALVVQSEPTYQELSRAPGALRARWRNSRKHPVPARTIPATASVAERIAMLSLPDAAEPVGERPRTRADCASVPRPCPYVGCRHHLFLDVTELGGLRLNFPDLEPDQLPAGRSCSLDIAEQGGAALEDIGRALNLTREGIRVIEVRAEDKIERRLPLLREFR